MIIQAVAVGILIFFLNVGLSGIQGLTVVVGALAVLGLGVFVGMRWSRAFVATVVVAYLIVLFTPVANVLANALAVKCSNVAGDTIVVLAGDPGDGRILEGVKLFGQGAAPFLMLTGDDRHPRGWRNYEGAIVLGVRHDRLVRVSPIGSGTRGEAEALRAAPQARSLQRVVLVTSRIHSLRATLTFRKEGFQVCSAPAPDGNAQSDSWDPWGRVLMARDLVHEGLGLIYYKARGWI